MPRRKKTPNAQPKRYCGARLPMSAGRLQKAIEGGFLSRYLARAGHTCRRPPMPGKRRCRLHGAAGGPQKTEEGRRRALANLKVGRVYRGREVLGTLAS
jgi:hypothetical protein